MQRVKETIVDAYPDQEQDIEIVHLYMVPDQEYQDDNSPQFDISTWANRFMACVACLLFAYFVLVPGNKIYQLKSLTVPLTALPVQTLTATSEIQATGVQNYPALAATGTITIYNGSLLSQSLPSGFIVTANDGTEFALDQAVTIDRAALPAVGMATVQAHALVAGSQGNIGPLAINQSYGSSLVVKNLTAFSGGQESYTKQFVTDQDRQQALQTARATLNAEKPLAIQKQPCQETAAYNTQRLTLIWACQLYSYHVPARLDVVSIQIEQTSVLVQYREVRHE